MLPLYLICSLCRDEGTLSGTFSSLDKLERHLVKLHYGNNFFYVCHLCPTKNAPRFLTDNSLQNHTRTVHGGHQDLEDAHVTQLKLELYEHLNNSISCGAVMGIRCPLCPIFFVETDDSSPLLKLEAHITEAHFNKSPKIHKCNVYHNGISTEQDEEVATKIRIYDSINSSLKASINAIHFKPICVQGTAKKTIDGSLTAVTGISSGTTNSVSSIDNNSESVPLEAKPLKGRIVLITNESDKVEKTISPGLCGLTNLGNTCFMNSAIQCLSNIPELVEYFVSGQHHKEISRLNEESPETNRGKLASEFGKLLQAMWSGVDAVHNPSEFKHELVKSASRFSGSHQHDAQEFTIFLLNGLHEELNRPKKTHQSNVEGKLTENPQNMVNNDSDIAWEVYKRANNSIVVDLFHGQLKSTLKCDACGIEDVRYDSFCFLSLPVPITTSATTIDECLSLFMEAEEIERICLRCHHNQFAKTLHVSRPPKYLIVLLKRFKVVNNYTSKIDTSVYFKTRNFNLFGANLKDANQKYDLIAGINHSGSISSGHYVSCAIRNDSNGRRAGYIFNDESVTKMVKRSIEADELSSNDVYMLYYRKQPNSLDNPGADLTNKNAIPISTDVSSPEAEKKFIKISRHIVKSEIEIIEIDDEEQTEVKQERGQAFQNSAIDKVRLDNKQNYSGPNIEETPPMDMSDPADYPALTDCLPTHLLVINRQSDVNEELIPKIALLKIKKGRNKRIRSKSLNPPVVRQESLQDEELPLKFRLRKRTNINYGDSEAEPVKRKQSRLLRNPDEQQFAIIRPEVENSNIGNNTRFHQCMAHASNVPVGYPAVRFSKNDNGFTSSLEIMGTLKFI
ncbi:ubiquitin carboxyl-terminal hydrolase domain-containing protein [Ditylenchus destructor]|nr:ubiquitin carboxyl-terminal hydrolase domain-containing protein [Ditylenchus destructor]